MLHVSLIACRPFNLSYSAGSAHCCPLLPSPLLPLQGIGSQAVSSLCCNEAWAAAGARAGWISVLDSRSGEVLWWWRGHEAATTALGAYHGHYLISGSKVGACFHGFPTPQLPLCAKLGTRL